MHLNILQGLNLLKFEGVKLLDIPIGGGIYLSTRGEIATEVAEGRIPADKMRMAHGTGAKCSANLYVFKVRLSSGGDDPFPQYALENFNSKSLAFLEALWLVKDNAGSAGMLYGVTFGEQWRQCNLQHATVHSAASCVKPEISFNLDELNEAVAYFHQMLDFMPKEEAEITGPPPMALRHPSRLGRALYFTQAARKTSEVGIKTAMYCIALECLFSTVVDGATKCVTERGSHFLENNDAERRATRNHLRLLYKYRSKVVHGSGINEKHETKLRQTAIASDEILRRAFRRILADPSLVELFSTDDAGKVNEFFRDEWATAT